MHFKLSKKIFFVLLLLPIIWSLCTKNPAGTSIESNYETISSLEFLYDLTYQKQQKSVKEQSILSAELDIIEKAEDFIVLDLFLYNDAYNKEQYHYPNTTQMITDALIAKKKQNPNIDIIFITDPINGFYGSYTEKNMNLMNKNDIIVIETNLDALKDSNPLYSGYYRLFIKPFGNTGKGFINNPLDKTAPNINIRSVLKLANFKANHRKLIITEKEALIASANPHDASSYHSNVAVRFQSDVIQYMLEGERTVAKQSGITLPELQYKNTNTNHIDNTKVKYITEKGIFNSLINNIKRAKQGDTIYMGIFYITDFDLIKELENAANRGVSIYIVADPNKDAFGIQKDGSPNRSVLTKLNKKSENIHIRWYDTHGEQYHTKMSYFDFENQNVIIIGSGNYTRKNIKGYNLEADLEIVTEKENNFSKEINAYFQKIWNNEYGDYTVAFETYQQNSIIKKVLYYIQETTGLCTY